MSTDAGMKSIRSLDDLIRGGLSDFRDQFDAARANEDYYRCRNRLHLEMRPNESHDDYKRRPKQFSYLTRRAIDTLTSQLYSPGPDRKGTEPGIDELMQLVAEKTSLNALMQRADVTATLNGWVAIQAVATGNPDNPIRLYLFGPDELVAIPREDDPLDVWACVTKTVVPGTKPTTKRIRYEAWTADETASYITKDFNPLMDGDSNAWERGATLTAAPQPNPYGVLPFAFAFNRLPINRFGGDGIGDPLREANGEIDRMLSDMGQLLEAYNRPQGFARNVADAFRWADRVGRFTKLPAASADAVEAGMMPEVFYLQPDVNVESTWVHIAELMNLTFQDLQIPLSAVRAQATSDAESGVAVLAKMAPLNAYTKSRQTAWTGYERTMATMVNTVYGAYYGVPTDPTATVDVTWPEPALPINATEATQVDAADLQAGLATKVQVIARRHGLTRAQAIKRLEQMAEDDRDEQRIMGDIERERAERQMAIFGGNGNGQLQQGDGQGQQQEQAEDDAEAEDDTEDQG